MKFDVLCPEGQMCDYPFEKPCRTNMPQISNLRGLAAILTHFSQEHEQTPYPTIKTRYRPSDSVLGGLHTFSPTARCLKIFQLYSHCSENNQFSSRQYLLGEPIPCSLYLTPTLIYVIVSLHCDGGGYVQTNNRFTIW